jgi:hypothetical protein
VERWNEGVGRRTASPDQCPNSAKDWILFINSKELQFILRRNSPGVQGVCPASRAALALEHGLPVLSRDHHFDVVPDLERKTW